MLPDGRMETTWRIKPDVVWHDGAPFTGEDLAFAVQVNGDRGIGIAPTRLSWDIHRWELD